MSETLRLFKRIWAFLRRRPLDNDLEDELAAHLQMAIDDNIARGLNPIEARRIALVSLGGMEHARYQHREARGFMALDIFKQDLARPQLHDRRRVDSRSGDRRKHCRIQRSEHSAAAAIAFSECARTGVDCSSTDQVRNVLRYLLN